MFPVLVACSAVLMGVIQIRAAVRETSLRTWPFLNSTDRTSRIAYGAGSIVFGVVIFTVWLGFTLA